MLFSSLINFCHLVVDEGAELCSVPDKTPVLVSFSISLVPCHVPPQPPPATFPPQLGDSGVLSGSLALQGTMGGRGVVVVVGLSAPSWGELGERHALTLALLEPNRGLRHVDPALGWCLGRRSG